MEKSIMDLKRDKEDLENKISELLSRFSNQYGVRCDNVETAACLLGSGEEFAVSYKVKIEVKLKK